MDLYQRYGTPTIVLNLVKSKERIPRESLLRNALGVAIDFINSTTDAPHQIKYKAWDFKTEAKNNKYMLQMNMYRIAQKAISYTGFFYGGPKETLDKYGLVTGGYVHEGVLMQKGVVRTNCIDSIDRTNAGQYVVGLCAMNHQLLALGALTSVEEIRFENEISSVLLNMYELSGHQLALQYGGSGLAHTMNTFFARVCQQHSTSI